ncbi:MAG: hypothetical protein QM607_11685, partial [Microbacterium sp.]
MSNRTRFTSDHVHVHEVGAMCAEVGAGHDMHLLQRRLVQATPSRWVDAIAGAVDADGWLE